MLAKYSLAKSALVMIATLALLFPFAVPATANPAKTGSGATGKAGWYLAGEEIKYDEAKASAWVGRSWGTSIMNDANAVLNNMIWVCDQQNSAIGGKAEGHGHCTVHDADGDTIFVAWKGNFTNEVTTEGQFVSGTGKFVGIEGGYKLSCGFLHGSQAICDVLNTHWKLK